MTHARTIPAIVAFLFAVHASGFGEAAILCVSPDGHVSLEARGAPCCGSEAGEGSAAPRAAAVAAAASIAGCGDCTDIPLGDAMASASVPVEPKAAVAAPSCVLAYAPAAPPADGAAGLIAPGSPAPERGSLSHIRSIILRR
jgi:hypothetical protein